MPCSDISTGRISALLVAIVLIGVALSGCGPSPAATETPPRGGQAMVFNLSSPAFNQGAAIPRKYTCDGEDLSPPLQWTEPPADTRSLALISDDPDAPVGTWVHWVVYNLPAGIRSLPEGASPAAGLPQGGVHGQNSWRRLEYGGPCPPSGTHRYFFKLYALDITLELGPGAGKKELLGAMEGHVLAQAELMGTYSRK